MSTYEVHIGMFEGPLDLLLYLVQKQEVDPRNVSVAEIAEQFLEHLKLIPPEDLGVAGEFLLMASRLMALKVRELLPADQKGEVDVDEFTGDREELIRQMMEYQRFKKVADGLRTMEGDNFGTFHRGRVERARASEEEALDNAPDGIWGLYRAFRKSLVVGSRESVHTIEVDDVTIEDRQQHIQNWFHRSGRALFEDLLGRDRRRISSAVTFMALMEMIKLDEVTFRQSDYKGALWIYRKRGNGEFADEMAAEMHYEDVMGSFKDGLAELVRGREQAMEAASRTGLDTVLREVSARVAAGNAVGEEELMAMIEGREWKPTEEAADGGVEDRPQDEPTLGEPEGEEPPVDEAPPN